MFLLYNEANDDVKLYSDGIAAVLDLEEKFYGREVVDFTPVQISLYESNTEQLLGRDVYFSCSNSFQRGLAVMNLLKDSGISSSVSYDSDAQEYTIQVTAYAPVLVENDKYYSRCRETGFPIVPTYELIARENTLARLGAL